MSLDALVIEGMRGLGDNIYQRAFVKAHAASRDVYLRTPWPEIYEDLPRVRFLADSTALRTQARNLSRQSIDRWATPPATHHRLRISYGSTDLRRGSIVDAMRECFRAEPAGFGLPATLPDSPIRVDAPIALVRPVTERREWRNAARNPLPEHVAEIAADLLARGYYVVSIADIQGSEEWLVGEKPPSSVDLHTGELAVRELLALVRASSVVVGGVGWIVPASIAAGVPLFCVLGGHGGHNAPDRITCPRTMDLTHVGFATPDRFCACTDMLHGCDKRISNLAQQWRRFRIAQGL